MITIKNAQCNHSFGPPQGISDKDCGSLPVKRFESNFGKAYTSFWKPTISELKILNEGGSVALTVYGPTHPMVSMGTQIKEEK